MSDFARQPVNIAFPELQLKLKFQWATLLDSLSTSHHDDGFYRLCFNERLCSTACQHAVSLKLFGSFQWATLLDSLSTVVRTCIILLGFQWATLLDSLSTHLMALTPRRISCFNERLCSTACQRGSRVATGMGTVSMSDFARQPVNYLLEWMLVRVSMSDFARQPVNKSRSGHGSTRREFQWATLLDSLST